MEGCTEDTMSAAGWTQMQDWSRWASIGRTTMVRRMDHAVETKEELRQLTTVDDTEQHPTVRLKTDDAGRTRNAQVQ